MNDRDKDADPDEGAKRGGAGADTLRDWNERVIPRGKDEAAPHPRPGPAPAPERAS